MRGQVVVMKPADYQRWLEQNGASQTLVAAGPSPVHAVRVQRLP